MGKRVIVNIIENALKGVTPSERMRRTLKAAVRVKAAKNKMKALVVDVEKFTTSELQLLVFALRFAGEHGRCDLIDSYYTLERRIVCCLEKHPPTKDPVMLEDITEIIEP